MAALNPEDSADNRWTARDGQMALWIFALALALRLTILGELRSSPFRRFPLVDARSYHDWAEDWRPRWI